MRTPHDRRYVARRARGARDLHRARALRAAAFGLSAPDRDAFDGAFIQIVIEDRRSGGIVGCLRMLPLAGGADLAGSYAAQVYDLARLARRRGPMIELGRLCTDPAARHPDILRAAWAAITAHVDARGVRMLFGCTSFRGTDPAPYADTFALLARRYLAPPSWAPGRRAAETVALAGTGGAVDARRALRMMPPLLRSYLAMGARLSDHAVIDRALDTLHVFTGVEVAAIPPARQRLLRADALALDGEGGPG